MLKTMAAEVTNVDGKIATLCEQMFEMMYEAPGLGLAAPQIRCSKANFRLRRR